MNKIVKRKKLSVKISNKLLNEFKKGTQILSRRVYLSVVMGWYDPLGLISPALVKAKILLRKLYGLEAGLGWDDELPLSERIQWTRWMSEVRSSGEVAFKRYTRPSEVIGDPALAGFADSSIQAYCAVVYIIWNLKDGGSPVVFAAGQVSSHASAWNNNTVRRASGGCGNDEAATICCALL